MLRALETAFKNEEVDTIYLLSDGAPTPPEKAGMKVILERMRKLNRIRSVKINTIGFDLKDKEKEFLRTLADEHFGRVAELDDPLMVLGGLTTTASAGRTWPTSTHPPVGWISQADGHVALGAAVPLGVLDAESARYLAALLRRYAALFDGPLPSRLHHAVRRLSEPAAAPPPPSNRTRGAPPRTLLPERLWAEDRKSTRLNPSHW